ncbi:MAG: methylated-DNA--[protein]-cysteine S-methyltransferase [Lachnospiraceae bacterium]|nr:methylated-DNA--[protein]-cysteine S-methyltransferase [Lachnospiraceae bacterium]
MIYTNRYTSPLGDIIIASDGDALTGLWFQDQKYFGATLPTEYEEKELSVFQETKQWLDIYFEGRKPDFIPLLFLQKESDITGITPFRKAVWETLLSIPYGETMTYGEIAKEIARQNKRPSMSAQAVGGAIGHNPVSIIIPCHRVVGTDGNLTGYAGGIERKKELLNLESLPYF